MSMLAEFLDCTKDSSDLFCGTKITKSVHYKELNRYPVVFLSFLNVKAGDAESLCYALKDTVRAEYERFYQILNDGRLSEFQVKEFNMIYNSLCQECIGKACNSFNCCSLSGTEYVLWRKSIFAVR